MLRVALILPAGLQAVCTQSMLRYLRSLAFVDLCLVIQEQPDADARTVSRSLLWKLFQNLEKSFFGAEADSQSAQNKGIQLNDVTSSEAVRLVTEQALDVIVHLGQSDPHPMLLAAARYGVWQYRFGTIHPTDPTIVGMREVIVHEPITMSALVQLATSGEHRILYTSCARTIPFFPHKNRNNVTRKCATFVVRKLRDLALYGADGLAAQQPQPLPDTRALTTPPGNLEMTGVLARLGVDILQRSGQKLAFIEQWFVAYRFGDEPGLPGRLSNFVSMHPPKDRFWADPFPIERDGRHYLFIEELMFDTNKGHISVVELDERGGWKQPVKVLERDYHLSYPFLFEWQGNLFMIPETGQNRTVEVYRCHRFPDDWHLEKVLLENVCSADATLAQIGDRWWMFVNIGEEGTELYDELHLFHADQPFGEWVPHRRNPVKSDARSARPAGNLFWWQGELYRPAQCCVPLYGSAISLNRIERLDPDVFIEREVALMTPDWQPGLLGVHTFNRAGRLTVVDGFRRTPKFSK